MPNFTYAVTVTAASRAQARQVMAERINHDEPIHTDADGNTYPESDGFDYSIIYMAINEPAVEAAEEEEE